MTAYTVVYTVTIAVEVVAPDGAAALRAADSERARRALFDAEWDYQDVRRLEIIAEGGEYIPTGDVRRLAVER